MRTSSRAQSAGSFRFSRILAGEVGSSGVRVVCLRPDAIPEAPATSHTREVFGGIAARVGTNVEDMLAERARTATRLKRLPTLAESRALQRLWPPIAPAR
jgi:3-oxoacyl-[acyl-carrier protein] reductase